MLCYILFIHLAITETMAKETILQLIPMKHRHQTQHINTDNNLRKLHNSV